MYRQNIPIPVPNNKNFNFNFPPGVAPLQARSGETNETVFFKSVHNLNGETVRILKVIPNFRSVPKKYQYEIHGTDGTRIENIVTNNRNTQLSKSVICFFVKKGETYFIKIEAFYQLSTNPDQSSPPHEIILFYKMQDDFEDIKNIDDIPDIDIKKISPDTNTEEEPNDESTNEEDQNSTITNVEDVDDEAISQVFQQNDIKENDEIDIIRQHFADSTNQIKKSSNSGLNITTLYDE